MLWQSAKPEESSEAGSVLFYVLHLFHMILSSSQNSFHRKFSGAAFCCHKNYIIYAYFSDSKVIFSTSIHKYNLIQNIRKYCYFLSMGAQSHKVLCRFVATAGALFKPIFIDLWHKMPVPAALPLQCEPQS